MQLSVREAASLMGVSEETVQRWIQRDGLTAWEVNRRYRLNRAELLEWAMARGIDIPGNVVPPPGDGRAPGASLAEAIAAGGVHYGVGGADKNTVLKSAIEAMPLPDDVDRAFLLDVLLARESLGSTAIGEGIAIPHVRNPIVIHVPRPIVALCFLDRAIEFGALDAKPVHTLFTMVSPTIAVHLNLLSKLALALKQSVFADAVRRRATRSEIVAGAAQVDSRMAGCLAAPPGGTGA